VTEKEIIELCRKNDRRAQKALFEKYSPKMFGVCKRYVKNREDAEDILIEGMYKVMANIKSFKGNGSFEGWIRRIVVNEALMFLRKKHNFKLTIEISNVEIKTNVSAQDRLQEQDILNLMNKLPTGYRTVFNLYVIEGYKHREIAEMLGISINTSKSQLILAKKRLQGLLKQNRYPDVG
jgi:RNA polymerase sigma-70 factor (ECF subfamily)